jgi:hypothetical protein
MKGQMSEAELHFIRARLRGGIVSKARRGELITPLPVGLVYDAAGHVVLDPDCCPALKAPMRDALCVPMVRGEKTPPGVAAAGFSSVRCRSLSAWCRWCQSTTSVTAERAAGSSTRFLLEANAANSDCRARLLTARG